MTFWLVVLILCILIAVGWGAFFHHRCNVLTGSARPEWCHRIGNRCYNPPKCPTGKKVDDNCKCVCTQACLNGTQNADDCSCKCSEGYQGTLCEVPAAPKEPVVPKEIVVPKEPVVPQDNLRALVFDSTSEKEHESCSDCNVQVNDQGAHVLCPLGYTTKEVDLTASYAKPDAGVTCSNGNCNRCFGRVYPSSNSDWSNLKWASPDRMESDSIMGYVNGHFTDQYCSKESDCTFVVNYKPLSDTCKVLQIFGVIGTRRSTI